MRVSCIAWPLARNLSKMILACFVTILLVSQRAALAAGNDPAGSNEAQQLEIIDAQAFNPTGPSASQPDKQPNITGDPTSSVDDKWIRKGAVADGTSVLIIRLNPIDQAGDVQFQIQDAQADPDVNSTEYLGDIRAYGTTTNIQFPDLPAPVGGGGLLTATASGKKIIFYRPPASFLFGPNVYKRDITLSVVVGGHTTQTRTITLYRTPLLVSHGVISKAITMNDLVNALKNPTNNPNGNSRNPNVFNVNEWDNNTTSGYNTVVPLVQKAIAKTIDEMRWKKGIATTRVDWVAHSMGGSIAKFYASDIGFDFGGRGLFNPYPPFLWAGTVKCKRDDNFGLGDFRRLVTFGAPYRGSKVGRTLQIAGPPYPIMLLTVTLANGNLGTGDACAVDDLNDWGHVTQILRPLKPKTAWYPISFTAGQRPFSDIVSFPWITQWPTILTQLICPPPATSDWIVAVSSQLDGHAVGGAFHSGAVPNEVHTQETGDPATLTEIEKALDLSNNPIDGGTLVNPNFN